MDFKKIPLGIKDGFIMLVCALLATSPIWIAITLFFAWVTHVVACLKAGALLLLVIGAVLAPIGVIHGVMIWLGIPWTV